MKFVLNVADTGPLESLAAMLEGHELLYPSRKLRDELRGLGCDCVLEIDDLVKRMGYERPKLALQETDTPEGAVLVDVKAHRNAERVRRRWPDQKLLWYRINGCAPEHVPGCGDEMWGPVLTPNQWYKDHPHAYTCWPPFVRFNEHASRGRSDAYTAPVCLIHNLAGWGYGRLVEPFTELGIKLYGERSPHGLVRHCDVPNLLYRSLCMVHLKSSDAPGYALYEALAAGCPVVCTRRLIWRCRMQELLESGVTCLVFDRETHDSLSDEDAASCTAEVAEHMSALQDRSYNERIGKAGQRRLLEVQWKDREGLESFLRRELS